MGVIFLCREVSRSTGEISVYPVGKATRSSDPLLFVLGTRQRLNPELQYYAVSDDGYQKNKGRIEKLLKLKEPPRKEMLAACNIIHL